MAETNTAPATPAPVPAETPVNPTSPAEPQIPKGEKVYVVKHPDGREEKYWGDKVTERLQKSVGLEQRVQKASQLEAAFANLVGKFQDPRQVAELLSHADLHFGSDKKAALIEALLDSNDPSIEEATKKWLYKKRVEPSLMDPKDREIMEAKSEAEQLRQEKAERERLLKEQEEIKQVEGLKQVYRQKLGESYQKSGLPMQDWLVRQVMEKARLFVRNGQQPDFDRCCQIVQTDFIEQVKGVLGSASVDKILTLMDGETPKKINQALMNALDKKEPSPVAADKPARPKRKEKEPDRKERKQWLRDLERGNI